MWPVSGSSQSWTVAPPASRYRREAGISSGKPPPATRRTGTRRDPGHHRDQRRRGLHARDGAHRAHREPAERALKRPLRTGVVAVDGPGGAVGDDGGQPAVVGGRVEQHLAAEREAEAGDALGVHVGPMLEVVEARGDGRLGVVAEAVGVPVALAVARVVERQHAVAVAGEHPHVGGDASAAPAGAMAEQDRRAVARRDVPRREPAAVAHRDADLVVRDPDGGLVDRPARSVRRHVGEREGQHADRGDDRCAGDPSDRVGTAPAEPASPGRAAGRRGGGDAGGDEQEPAGDVADAGDVAPVGARVDDMQAVGDDAKADGDQSDTTPSTSRVGRVTCGWASAHAAARATITATPSADVSGPDSARSSRCAVTSARPASRRGRSARAARDVIVVMPPRSRTRRPPGSVQARGLPGTAPGCRRYGQPPFDPAGRRATVRDRPESDRPEGAQHAPDAHVDPEARSHPLRGHEHRCKR